AAKKARTDPAAIHLSKTLSWQFQAAGASLGRRLQGMTSMSWMTLANFPRRGITSTWKFRDQTAPWP
ncbi:unnamed protein product, partial [Polarella glacialis]